jgi:hypothetical protein
MNESWHFFDSNDKWTHFAGKQWLQTQFHKDRNIRDFGVAHQ